MVDTTMIQEGMAVVDCQGEALGSVDHLDAGRLLLRQGAGPVRPIPLSEVSEVRGEAVVLQLSRSEVQRLEQRPDRESHTEA
ncbi:Hypothetical protein HVPorG_01046 [Roseomonas mucosa]|uniref:DUF2171 domain-containing protein n=1 Tax=Roseomonas TaxID=125216 RepID=UPI00095980A1|nr:MULTISPECIES: DUF2171 domain-containing protein [Roseomonas]QDJ08855.1 Hypothetical protein HVPorG_01046 [Roseomonas mucosa]USQ70495.1 DUF2171 domain-containing protein [Roseomonas mucosa]UZO96187.1 Hypothetical protein RMHFA_01046 [Roseomonas mucosa]GAV35121.1 hypothetical protein ROTAS13_02793 [Roseomonas sp. TAS13]